MHVTSRDVATCLDDSTRCKGASTSGPPIIASWCTAERLKPERVLRLLVVGQAGRGEGVGVAPRDVTGRVLVDQDVAEHHAGLADRGGTVNERDLAQASRARVDRHLRPHAFRAVHGVHLHGATPLEADRQVLHPAAADEVDRAGHTAKRGSLHDA